MKDYTNFDYTNFTGWIVAIAISVGALCFAPVITFALAYFGGWILKICVGGLIVDGLNLLFDTARFNVDIIPVTCATLAIIGRYFKSNPTSNKSK